MSERARKRERERERKREKEREKERVGMGRECPPLFLCERGDREGGGRGKGGWVGIECPY